MGHPVLDSRVWQWAFHTNESNAKFPSCLLLKNRRTALLSNTLTKQLMSTVNCVITPEIIMKKLHTLRSQYRREVKEMKTSQKSGAGTDDLYLPRLWCYHTLAFLGYGDTPPDSSLNLDELLIAAAACEAVLSSVHTNPPTASLRLVRVWCTSHSVYQA